MNPDYPISGHTAIDGADELGEFLRAHDGTALRVLGLGTRQSTLPAPERCPHLISLGGMRSIIRLEAEDLTCTVQPGISRSELDSALDQKRVQLPGDGGGSLGGLFASGGAGPAAPGAMSPRALLLGMECLLAEGLVFKSGARVVKNVAGYDLPKLFVGSRGKLFIVTLLHLKLRPAPRHRRFFCRQGLDRDQALALFTRLRLCSPTPSALHLHRADGSISIVGQMDGRSKKSVQLPAGEDLCAVDSLEHTGLIVEGSGQEIVGGNIRPSRLGSLLELLPSHCQLTCSGCGQFEVRLTADQSDSLLLQIGELGGQAEIRGAVAERRGRASAIDRGHEHISAGLKQALDPQGILQ